ncbi:MAG TPA: hypothetical protein DCZ95_14825 [Verrucomicrobia bacterium]|nr:MAG: hypothetical protein A2X46_18070 [Lentisphaerae bacterium GWF2_57_35]HBA85358.1 hypothetical protein [Verrucomicrobiota bacterium]
MSDDLRIVFPMRVDASQLFEEIHKNAARWRREMDMTDSSRAALHLKVKLLKAAPITPSSSRTGHRVNLIA